MPIALVRAISASFDRALTQRAGPGPDVRAARAEHAAYVAALERAGAEVRWLPPDEDAPDACFVEDTVVVAGGIALLTRPGAASRRAEVDAMAQALPAHLTVRRLRAPATLDGGDVLRVGQTLFVGRSARTNAAGIEALAEVFGPAGFDVVQVEVKDALHLKCHASALGEHAVLLAEGFADPRIFAAVAEVVPVPPAEAYAANVVVMGTTVLVAAGHPEVLSTLNRRGLDPIPLDVRQVACADGSLTCLSVLIP